MATTSTGQAGGLYLPTQKIIGNRKVTPASTTPEQLDPNTGRVDQPGFGMDYRTTSTTGGGLMGAAPTEPQQPGSSVSTTQAPPSGPAAGQSINVTKPVKPASPEFNYESNDYTGVQGSANKQYDPRSESLVQNQLTGLLDPNSALMKRTVSQTQEQAAARGLQSSSIAAGAGMGAMIDRALPIAQQDAQTYSNAQQLGWQQNFQAEQTNLNRQHDASMFDKNATFQAQMQDLQHRQQLGTLDYQGQLQLQQMERSAQLNQQRDYLLQQFQNSNMDKTFLQQLEMTQLQWQRDDAVFAKNIDANAQAQYRASSAEAYNRYLEQVSAVYNNPNMTADQQRNAVLQLEKQWKANQASLQAIFGFAAPSQPGTNSPDTNPGAGSNGGSGSNVGVVNPVNPGTGGGVQVTKPVYSGGSGGGTGSVSVNVRQMEK